MILSFLKKINKTIIAKIENSKKAKIDRDMHVENDAEYIGILKTFELIEKRRMFNDAIINGETGLIRAFLEDRTNEHDNSALRLACSSGQLKVVELLLSDDRWNPIDFNNLAFKYAAKGNHLDVLKLLLSDPRFDPTLNDGHLLVESVISHGFSLEIIELLLRHPKVNLSTQNNICLYYSVASRNLKLVMLFLRHPKIVIDFKAFNIVLGFGLENGHLDLVKTITSLEKQKGLDLFDRGSCYFMICAFNNHMNVVRFMLEDDRILEMFENDPESEAKHRVLNVIEYRTQRKAAGVWVCKKIGRGWGDVADILQRRMTEY